MKHVILTTGFMKPHFWNYGIIELFHQLGDKASLYRWNDVCPITQHLVGLIDQGVEEIIMVGHSYGVSTNLFVCEKLKIIVPDFFIDHFVSTDGIWRPEPNWPSFRSLHDGQILNISGNISQYYSFRQKKGILQGHSFEFQSPKTELIFDKIVKCPHYLMDGLPEFKNLVLELSN